MHLFVSLIRLGIRVSGFPIRLVRRRGSAIGRRLRWLRPAARTGLKFLVAARSNSIASTAIALSVINFGLLLWQIWPEDTAQTVISQPTQISEVVELDNTPRRISELENRIRELSIDHRFEIDRIRDCINFPSPFGCR